MPELQEMKKQARSLFDRKDYKAAIEVYDQLAKFALSQQNEFEASEAFNNAGVACRLLNQYDAAQRYFEYSLQIDRKKGNKDSPEMAITLQHLGRISFLKEDLRSCWNYWTEALEIWKRVCRVEPGYINYLASCLFACGEYFAKTGEYSIARKNFEQALTLRQNILPPDHPDIAENLGGLGAMCMNLHDFASAIVYLKRAIPLYQSELGPNDRQIMDLQRMLAFCESQNTKRHLNPFKRK